MATKNGLLSPPEAYTYLLTAEQASAILYTDRIIIASCPGAGFIIGQIAR
jgi:hypothetical protein